jgi:hypothetical protein
LGSTPPTFTLKRLDWRDAPLGTLELPARPMHLRMGYGSGLARRPGDPQDIAWAVGDRGPNIKVEHLVELYGVEHLRPHLGRKGAKVMMLPEVGPRIAQLRIGPDRVELLAEQALHDGAGPLDTGLPNPAGEDARREPALDLAGQDLAPDPAGFDTEAIAATRDGNFWIGDEFGPSLVQVAGGGQVLSRCVPEGVDLPGAPFPVHALLPAIAAHRQLNRGFEALAFSADEKWLFLAFQSPLAHPDVATHKKARHVRLWRLDAATLTVAGQYLYPLDPPDSFLRDCARGEVDRSDIKVSEMVWIGADRLLLLERASLSTRVYRVELGPALELPACHLEPATRPTVEEMSAAGTLDLPVLAKHLLFDSDLAPELPGDQEGMLVLSPAELLLVNDNDFGVEGAETQFWKVVFDDPVLE